MEFGNFENPDQDFIKSLFDQTEILKKPITGIVTGYHQVPYVLIGPDMDANSTNACIEIQGKINVSPKLIISPQSLGTTYGDIFSEFDPDLMDQKIVGRMFSFMVSKRFNNINIENEDFKINKFSLNAREQVNKTLDNQDRAEIINTGVIFSPNMRFYPISIDKFLNDIIDKELG